MAMRRSITAARCEVTHVYEADLQSPFSVVRTLVSHPDLPEEVRLLPMAADEKRLSGMELLVEDIDEMWMRLDEPTSWKSGSVPVSLTKGGQLIFSTPGDLRTKKLRWVSEEVSRTFGEGQHASLLQRVATLEHTDGILGGHALTTGALLLLAEENSDAPEIGGYDRLRSRFHAIALDGLPTLQRELARPVVQNTLSDALADRIVGAARRAARLNGVFTKDAWTECGERTLWSWWVHLEAGKANIPLRELAKRLSLSVADLMALAKAEAVPRGLGVQEKVPPREEVVRVLECGLREQPRNRDRVAFTHRAHRARLGLFVRQTSELERVFTEGRLARWSTVRDHLRIVRGSLQLQSFQHPWQAAEFMSEELLGHVARADGADAVESLLTQLGSILAGTVLPFGRQQGSWHVEPDGAPILFLTPTALELRGGARRFAVLHQLGHLVAGHEVGCTKWAEDSELSHRQPAVEEQFANAFAAYLAAPRHAVLRLVGRPASLTEEWLQAASRDVAIEFGLGPDAALPHVLNCLARPVKPWQTRMGGWSAWREEVINLVSDRWSEDEARIFAACGHVDRTSVEEAVSRPHSPVYEGLMRRAADDDQVPKELLDAYGL